MVFPLPRATAPSLVALDAFGTLLSNPRQSRPFAKLRDALGAQGVDVADFSRRAMTSRHTFASLAESYGVSLPMKFLARLDAELMEELLDIRPYPEAERTIRHLLSRGATVVVASNLAWPYALPVQSALDTLARGLSSQSVSRVRTVFSFSVGVLKPDPAFYSRVAEIGAESGVPAYRMFMVGDCQANDVDGPILAGWKAWKMDRVTHQGLLDAPWDEWLG